jgi:uncharacterized cupin superfamily protein
MLQPIIVTSAASSGLNAAPIIPTWVMDGHPEARNRLLATTRDKTAFVVSWECTPGKFKWDYDEDEIVYVIHGRVFISTSDSVERCLGAGDVAFFPAGSSCIWRVTETVRKVAVVRKDIPLLFGVGLRAWHKLLRVARIRGQMRL